MTQAQEAAPLADTLWRLGALMPWRGAPSLAEAEDRAQRRPAVLALLHSLGAEQERAVEGALAMADTAFRRACDAGQRLAAARNPLELATAQTGLALALAEWSATPARAWLDSLPRLHACCMAAVEDAGEANSPNGAAAPAAAPGRVGPAHDRAAAE
jgi:hypothetical protein